MKQMTFGEMKIFTQRYKNIMNLPIDRHHKGVNLAALMDDLEKMFNIPFFHNEEYEVDHPELMSFYRTVSEARSL
ncbi:hypothetical protein [Halobacillus karajensis]|uniref:hypothetical protein n=1 Tax=Halobacillus karajensis TaxID=195088 RepID=UPI00045CD676|nr:hypothetical protein [Halobacillus karajensis]CDQ17976.1 hypothetical protein BN982_00216 [Halobacillus karajensis]